MASDVQADEPLVVIERSRVRVGHSRGTEYTLSFHAGDGLPADATVAADSFLGRGLIGRGVGYELVFDDDGLPPETLTILAID